MSLTLQNFYKSSLTRNWSATTGDFNVGTKPTVYPGYLVVSPNNATLREIIYYTAVGTNSYGDFVTVANVGDRGIGGTSVQTHTIGETVRMNITAEHYAAVPQIFTGTAAPATTPTKKGDLFIDSTNHKVYISDGTTNSGNWVLLN